jgi:alcohol dehydrogenase YqhD (iron-dependent ADH family)
MHTFEFYNPVHLIFGAGEVKRVGSAAATLGQKAMLVTYSDHSYLDPVIEKIEASLKAEGISLAKYFGVSPNPKMGEVAKGVQICKESEAEFLIGLGGGSAMDATKMIAAGALYPGDLWDMVFSRHDNSKVAVPPSKALPTLMIPTLPATGSEMNPTAVVTNEQIREKSYTWNPCLYPKISIADPELTVSLPAYQSACAAADTLSHVLEFYLLGFKEAFLNNRIQEGVMLTVLEYFPFVLRDPGDVNARAHLQWASIVALNGWSQPGDGWTPMHQLGHVLSAHTECAHGASLSIVMPAWMKHYYKTNLKQYGLLATRVFGIDPTGKSPEDLALAGIDRFESLLKDWALPTRLADIGLAAADIPALTGDVVRVSFGADGTMLSKPPATREDVAAVYKLAA